MPNIRATAFPQIKPGNAAMYYPEFNVLIGRTVDPHSKTPAFKGVVVRVEPMDSIGGVRSERPLVALVVE